MSLLPRRAIRPRRFDLAIPICELKKAVRLGASLFGLDTNAIASHLQNLRPVIGRVKTGDIMAGKKKKSGGSVAAQLRAKASKSGHSVATLRKVYKRGQAAYLSSGSRNVPMAAWAMGRVNSYIRGSKKHDTDLRRGGGGKKKKKA